MILKASQRGGGQDLAVHLMRTDDNEHIELHELRGFSSDGLKGAFREIEATAQGTQCRQYLFSLSLSPPEVASVSGEVFQETIDRIEKRLGLEGQPRAIVFHEKEGRRHAHCVWSRIDAETMTAKQLSFFKNKLTSMSRELYLEHGWDMPRGLAERGQRNPLNFTLAEWQQAKRQGVDPRWIKQNIQECWKLSDGPSAFARSLEERGLFLAKGDKRGLVVLDHQGEVYSLPRQLDLKSKEVRARLGDGSDLPSVEAMKVQIGARMTPAIRRHIEESRQRFRERSSVLADYKSQMTELHRTARAKLRDKHDAEWKEETRVRAARLPRGIRGLWHRLTGQYQAVRRQNEHEARCTQDRHARERQTLIEAQLKQRAVLQERVRDLRSQQAKQLGDLRFEIGRYLKLARSTDASARSLHGGLGLRLTR